MTNVHDGLSVYKSGKEYFIGVSDEDAVNHSKVADLEAPEKVSSELYLSDKVKKAFKEFIQEENLADVEEDGGLLCDIGLYKILEGETDGVIEHYANAKNPAEALELCMRRKTTMATTLFGEDNSLSPYPGYIVAQLDLDARYSKMAILKFVEDLKGE